MRRTISCSILTCYGVRILRFKLTTGAANFGLLPGGDELRPLGLLPALFSFIMSGFAALTSNCMRLLLCDFTISVLPPPNEDSDRLPSLSTPNDYSDRLPVFPSVLVKSSSASDAMPGFTKLALSGAKLLALLLLLLLLIQAKCSVCVVCGSWC